MTFRSSAAATGSASWRIISARPFQKSVSASRFQSPARSPPSSAEEDPLLDGIDGPFDAFVGHKEAVQELPPGCTHLVAGDACPFQMIRFGENVYATQFHPEADGDVFALRIRIYRDKGYFAPAGCRTPDGRCAFGQSGGRGGNPAELRQAVRLGTRKRQQNARRQTSS